MKFEFADGVADVTIAGSVVRLTLYVLENKEGRHERQRGAGSEASTDDDHRHPDRRLCELGARVENVRDQMLKNGIISLRQQEGQPASGGDNAGAQRPRNPNFG